MGILSRLDAGRQVRASAQQVSSALTPMSSELIKWLTGVTASGKAVNELTSTNVSAAWCCRRILAESIGMLPWSMFRKEDNGNAEKADDHWLQDVLVYSPNRDQTSPEYRESKGMGLTGEGNAYSFVERSGKRITSLTPIFGVEPTRKYGSNTRLQLRDGEVFFRVNNRGVPEDLPREKVWQVRGFGRDPLKGLSPIGAAREALGGALAMEDFANRFFAQGGMPSGTVSYPGWLNKDQREIARDNLQKMVGGLGNAHKFALFEGGVKPEPWNTMNMEEMQFIVGRRFSVLEVCRFYRVPPHMVAELEKGASYASIEQMSQEFVMFTLMPYLTRFEASVTKWLLPPEERRKYFLRFNYEGLLRADSKGRAEMYASAVQNGWMNRNEVRGKENMNQVDGLDGYTAQTNLASVEKIVEGALEKSVEKVVALLRSERSAPPAAMPSVTVGPLLQVESPQNLERSLAGLAKSTKKATDELGATVREATERADARTVEATNASARALEVITDALSATVLEATSRADARAIAAMDVSSRALEALAEASRAAAGPRRLVYDAKGEVIGSEPGEPKGA